jgi:hypothetical protein
MAPAIKPKTESSLRPRVCAGCAAEAPKLCTMGTLAHYGWRLRVVTLPDKTVRGEYCCPTCWQNTTGATPLTDRRVPWPER